MHMLVLFECICILGCCKRCIHALRLPAAAVAVPGPASSLLLKAAGDFSCYVGFFCLLASLDSLGSAGEHAELCAVGTKVTS